jgi:hypothetical protein
MHTRLRLSVLFSAAVVSAAVGLAPAAQAADRAGQTPQRAATVRPASSFYDELHNRNSGKCVNVQNGSPDAGVWIQQYHCDHTPADKFLFADLGNGYYEIEGQDSHKCVQPENGWYGNGVPLNQWYCTGSAAEQWQFQWATNGSYRLVNRSSGMCMDVPNWSSDDWVVLQQWTCAAGSANQEFYLLGG